MTKDELDDLADEADLCEALRNEELADGPGLRSFLARFANLVLEKAAQVAEVTHEGGDGTNSAGAIRNMKVPA